MKFVVFGAGGVGGYFGGKLAQSEIVAKGLPLAIADHADKQLLACLGGVEHVIDRPGRDTYRHRFRRRP